MKEKAILHDAGFPQVFLRCGGRLRIAWWQRQVYYPLQTRLSTSLGLVTVRRSREDVAVVGRGRLSGHQDLLSSLHAPLTPDEFGHARLVTAAAAEVPAATVRHFRALRAFLRQERHSWRPGR